MRLLRAERAGFGYITGFFQIVADENIDDTLKFINVIGVFTQTKSFPTQPITASGLDEAIICNL